MLRRTIQGLAFAAVALCALAADAQAATYSYISAVLSSTALSSPVYMRYFNPNSAVIFNGDAALCAAPDTWDAATRSCQVSYRTPASGNPGYRAPLNDVFNDTGNLNEVRYAVWDVEVSAGSTSRAGYYFWAGASVKGTETSDWRQMNCVGSGSAACLGQGNATNAAGTDQAHSLAGAVAPLQGFRPIPVPQPVAGGASVVNLSWSVASLLSTDGTSATAQYDLYYAARACGSSPTQDSDFTFLKTVSGTSTSVAVSDMTGAANNCAWFALKIRYPNAATTSVTSLYLSAASLPVSYDASAATVTGLRAMYMRNLGVQVSFKTTSESNTQGFYIARSFSPNGPFVRVSPLIAAKGEANSYTYMDATRALVVRGGKLLERVDVVSRDGKANSFGPVLVDIPGSNNRAPLTPATNSRFATQR
ncbi:MAG: hypothetical protein ABFD65_07480 [Candidatus Polarisedimenticolia bacterium]